MTTNAHDAVAISKLPLELADRLDVQAGNLCKGGADSLSVAGAMALGARALREMHGELVRMHHEVSRLLRNVAGPDELEDDDAGAPPPPARVTSSGDRCRHAWTPTAPEGSPDAGKVFCSKCGAAKGKQGRKPAAAAPAPVATVEGVTKADPPSLPLKVVGSVAADKYTAGPV